MTAPFVDISTPAAVSSTIAEWVKDAAYLANLYHPLFARIDRIAELYLAEAYNSDEWRLESFDPTYDTGHQITGVRLQVGYYDYEDHISGQVVVPVAVLAMSDEEARVHFATEIAAKRARDRAHADPITREWDTPEEDEAWKNL